MLLRAAVRPGPVIVAVFLLLIGLTVVKAEQPVPTPAETIDGHPALIRSPRHTTTANGNQGDAINVAFVGTEEELHRMFAAAGWYAADPITLKTSVRIAATASPPGPQACVS
jgi:hypothetical protein